MKNIFRFSALLLPFLAGSLFLINSCSRDVNRPVEIDPEFANYISAYTSGVIPNDASIIVRLATDHPEAKPGELAREGLFEFDPDIKGEAFWTDSRTLEFRPSDLLMPGTVYNGTFHLDKLMDVPSKLSEFPLQFKVRDMYVSIKTDGLSTPDTRDLTRQELSGKVFFSGEVDLEKVEKSFGAIQDGQSLKMNWREGKGSSFEFAISGIRRSDKISAVKISYDGAGFGSEQKGEKVIKVPSLGDFSIDDIRVNQLPEQYVIVHYSDPLDARQNLDGLVTVSNTYNLTYSVDGHNLLVYPSGRLSGTQTVSVYAGVKNVKGYSCSDTQTIDLDFEELKPNVRLVGDGVIVPTSEQGMLFPFEAVNLKAVDISVIRIYENNVIQFLQVNDFNESSQLKRVGKKILSKRVELDPQGELNLGEWNRFQVDLSEVVQNEPGAIYHIEIRFKKDYSLYPCDDVVSEDRSTTSSSNGLTQLEASKEEEWSEREWSSGYWDDYEEDYYYDYDWRQRENPCHGTYYYNRGISRNVLVSDIGIISKAGDDKVMKVFLTDLRTTQPLSGCKVEFYNFQQQLIGSGTTNGEGYAEAKLSEKPFVLIAKKDKQKGYLRMRDGEALSMSKFDVDGERVQKGVKGFIYTERGVWRPGDSIYVSFMLEDKENVLPDLHPVTMELINPRGSVTKRITKTDHVNGLYDFRTFTTMDDPTGYYTARVSVGNREFSKSLRVETVKPNRLKILMDFGAEMLTADQDKEIELNSKWLHGAPAKNLKARVEATLSQTSTSFKNYKGFVFDDPTRSFSSEEQVVFDGRLDEEGHVTFSPSFDLGQAAPGMLRANFVSRVFEEGGGFSIDRKSVIYSPYSSYVGVKIPEGDRYNGALVTDKDHTVEVATVNALGKPVSRQGLIVKVYHIQWRWWWDHYNENLATYLTGNGATPILDTRINTAGGKGNFKLRVNQPSWGRYLVYVKDPETGHAAGKVIYIDWPYWARANRKDNENATMLNFSTDKETYKVGEKVKVSFPSPEKGRALVSIESGIRVVKHFWVETEKGETKLEFETTAEMSPNVFVNIALLQPHASTENDLPIRMYGVIPITVEDPASHLYPVIEAPEVIRPESTAKIKVREKNGKAMTYTIAMVDEGLLDLTSFQTPDPWKHFYAKEALGVRTWDLYDDVMGAFTAKMDKLLAIGGDGEAEGKKGARANRFKPMVYFSGPHYLRSGSATHEIKIPNYVGSVRIMVIARQEEAYGHAEKTATVRNPLMVLGTLPRVVGPGETVKLPVDVFAMEPHVKNVSIEIKTNNMFTPLSDKTKNMTFAKPGEEIAEFELGVAEKLGVGKVTIIARSGKETAKHEIEIDVRTPNSRQTDVLEASVEPGQSWTGDYDLYGIEGTNNLMLEVSSIPHINLNDRLRYLISYPHGCIEQTTSSAFPQLYLSSIMDLNQNFKNEISTNIKAAITRISQFQTADGGFSYWPGQSENSAWGSNYAGHFLLEAQEAGYKVPSHLLSKWISYQQKSARNWRMNAPGTEGYYYQDDLTQAFRLFTLAKAKKPELGAMNRLRESGKLNLSAKWRLAAAYQLAGQAEVAKKLINGISTNVNPYVELSYSYGNNVRDEAMILEALVLMGQKAKAGQLLKEVSARLNENSWMSTQTTAYCLLAVSKFAGQYNTNRTMIYSIGAPGFPGISNETGSTVSRHEVPVPGKGGKGSISFRNQSKEMVFVKLVAESIPLVGEETSASNNVAMTVNYFSMNGQRMDVSRILQGTDFYAEVTVSNPGTRGYLREMALNLIFPSGWEIHNARMDEGPSALQSDASDYQDILDDRIYKYYQLAAGKSKTFRVKLNASYQGRFYLPGIVTEAMYDNSIQARASGKWVTVVSPDGEIASE